MTEFKSIQELLNTLCSCIAVDDSGQSYIRTKASGVTPGPDPDPGPGPDPDQNFTLVAGQDDDTSNIYN